MRHAKSSWDDPGLADHDRPLNKRGRRDAPRVGEWLRRQRLRPELIVSSTAKRARKTAELVAESCGYDGELVVQSELYHASLREWLSVIQTLPESASRVLCVGHNPGLEEALASWTHQEISMPTAAVAHLELSCTTWKKFDGAGSVSLRAVQCVKELESE